MINYTFSSAAAMLQFDQYFIKFHKHWQFVSKIQSAISVT